MELVAPERSFALAQIGEGLEVFAKAATAHRALFGDSILALRKNISFFIFC